MNEHSVSSQPFTPLPSDNLKRSLKVARTDAEFVLGSAVPHQYDLVLGSHSVHTTPAALRNAQAHVSAMRTRLVQEGRL
jgi:hypothetical protein